MHRAAIVGGEERFERLLIRRVYVPVVVHVEGANRIVPRGTVENHALFERFKKRGGGSERGERASGGGTCQTPECEKREEAAPSENLPEVSPIRQDILSADQCIAASRNFNNLRLTFYTILGVLIVIALCHLLVGGDLSTLSS